MLNNNETHWEILKIAGPIVGAFLASMLGFVGVLLSLRSGDKRDRKARELEMRRQVFFDATESMSAAMSHLADLANLDRDTAKSGSSGRIEAVRLIATEPTLRAVAAFQSRHVSAQAQLHVRRAELVGVKSEHERLISLLKNTPPDNSQYEQFEQKMDNAARALALGKIDMLALAIQELETLWPLFSQAILAMRDELEMPVDKAMFLAISKEQGEHAFIETKRFTSHIRTKIAT